MSAPTIIETVRSALEHIPADLARDDWAKVIAAVKSEFPGTDGHDAVREWSATAAGFSEQSFKDTWASFKRASGVTIASLFYEAKKYGYTPKQAAGAARPDPQAMAQRAKERADQAERERQETAVAQDRAAVRAAEIWAAAVDVDAEHRSPYLERKGVKAYGVRVQPDGTLIVPLRDGTGKLWTVQFILPERPAKGPEKPLMKDGRKQGCWHMLGNPQGASVLLLAEGYATAASLHEATGWPVAMGVDAGNLAEVAKALHALYPLALLTVCADDDLGNQETKGANSGRAKATACAKAVGGVLAFPQL